MDAPLIHWKDSMNRTVGGFWLLFLSFSDLTKQGVEVKLTDRVQTQEADEVYHMLLDTMALWNMNTLTY